MKLSHALVEGGQTWAHRARMARQVLKMATSFSLVLGIGFLLYLILSLDSLLFQSTWYHIKAKFCLLIGSKTSVSSYFWSRITQESYPSSSLPVESARVLDLTLLYHKYFLLQFVEKSKLALIFTLCVQCSLLAFFFIRGKRSKRKIHISGRKIASAWKISLKLKLQGKISPFKIGRLHLVKDSETQHILVSGGTGSGKTNCFHHLLPQIRKAAQRAVVVDTNGVFIERYFREGKDIILNPFDERGKPWHPWAECKSPYDYKAIAESFIPQSYSEDDNYWRTTARIFFTALLEKTNDLQKVSELTKWIMYSSLSDVAAFLRATKAASVIDMNSERTASSVRSVASTFLECIETLKDTENPFSIRDWVQGEKDDSWLFLFCKPDQRAELIPLLSCWFSIASRSLLQMQTSFTRRLWFILDELASLNKLKNLESFITESRKYGGCGLLALQSPAQLEAIYGEKVSKVIIGNCSTKVVFSEQDPEVAEKISKFFGEKEIIQFQEGISYGAHEMRDGVSLSGHARNLPSISSSDIQSLEKNRAYIKLPGNLPITKVKLEIVGHPVSNV